MQTAMNAARTARFFLSGAPEALKTGATQIEGTEARDMATAGLLRCEEVHCEAPIFFRQYADRAPH